LNENAPEPPEPKGKVDTVSERTGGRDFDWDAIVWPVHEELVRRLRCRIFKASKAGDLAMVRNLQKMMLRSWSNTLTAAC